MNQGAGHYVGFGLHWQSDLPLTRFTAAPEDGPVNVRVFQVETPAERELMRLHLGAHVQLAMGGFRHTAREAVLDVFPGAGGQADRIEVTRGPEWADELPAGFYATMTALLLTLRGAIPLHGSAVEYDGQAVLLCGPSGAGKSTLAAGLIALGGRLISDDLSVLHLQPRTGQYVLYAGRRTMRLFEATAGYLQQAVTLGAPPTPAEGKIAVAPPQVNPAEAFPLKKLVLLGSVVDKEDSRDAAASLTAQLFRPKWMQRFPGWDLRRAALIIASRQLDLIHFAAGPVADRESFLKWSRAVAQKI